MSGVDDYRFPPGPLSQLHHRNTRAAWSLAEVTAPGVDPQRLVSAPTSPRRPVGPFKTFDEQRWRLLDTEIVRNTLSQLRAGEHLVMDGCARLCSETEGDWRLRSFAAQQCADEARHVEAVTVLCDALGDPYPPSEGLTALWSDIRSTELDLLQVAMQAVLEPMTVNVLTELLETVTDPTSLTVLKLIRSDESRHVGFGMSHLAERYQNLTSTELRHRQQFVIELIDGLEGRLVHPEVADRVGMTQRDFSRAVLQSPRVRRHRYRQWSTCVRVCRRIGLASAADGWLETQFVTRGMNAFPAVDDRSEDQMPAPVS